MRPQSSHFRIFAILCEMIVLLCCVSLRGVPQIKPPRLIRGQIAAAHKIAKIPKKHHLVRAADYRSRLGLLPKSFELSEISLKVPSNSLGAFYEAGNICAALYSEALPEGANLTQGICGRA
jgi:hypothetical protein